MVGHRPYFPQVRHSASDGGNFEANDASIETAEVDERILYLSLELPSVLVSVLGGQRAVEASCIFPLPRRLFEGGGHGEVSGAWSGDSEMEARG